MAPGVTPSQPVRGLPVAAQHHQAEQVVEAAAVDPDHDCLGSVEQLVERELRHLALFPEFGARPPVGPQPDADFDVEVLRGEQRHVSSDEQTTDLTSLMRTSSAVFSWKKKEKQTADLQTP